MSESLSSEVLQERREQVFLILAGVFLCAMTMLNIIGITRIVELGPLTVAIGVLPYPITFLCTDIISELYGRKRANFLVWVGLFLNGFILLTMWVADMLPAAASPPPWQTLQLATTVGLPDGTEATGAVELFHLVYACTAGAVAASMVAYILAQFVDVYIFHFLKKLTAGKHLWLRNNGSTLVSQLVDSVSVMGITFGMSVFNGKMAMATFITLVVSNYTFKVVAALIDTGPIYFLVGFLSKYLKLDPKMSH